MYTLLTLDVARDAVADQFTYGEPLSSVVHRRGGRTARPADPVRGRRPAAPRPPTCSPPSGYRPAS